MKFGVIFDMDGVIIDSNPYHKRAWKTFCMEHGIMLSDEDMEEKVFGRTGVEALSILFDNKLTQEEIAKYVKEIDANYRVSFAKDIKPLLGLIDFLDNLKSNNVTCAIATSAPTENVDFVMEKTGVRDYYKVIVDNTGIEKSKPNPEIYLKTANLLGISPENCIVFEDSMSGIQAAQNAGMKVIGISTTHTKEELAHTDYVAEDFNEINLSILSKIFENQVN